MQAPIPTPSGCHSILLGLFWLLQAFFGIITLKAFMFLRDIQQPPASPRPLGTRWLWHDFDVFSSWWKWFMEEISDWNGVFRASFA